MIPTPVPTSIVVLSGGMDSTVLAYWARAQGDRLVCVSFDYGQRHRVELLHASMTTAKLRAEHVIVDLSSLGSLLKGSALTDPSVDVPDGHYAEESMRATVVPNRNLIMLSIAAGLAVAEGAWRVCTGVHAGDHAVYPDCRPAFIDAASSAIALGNEGFGSPDLHVSAPFVLEDKAGIAALGAELGVPWEDTWSCYRGGEYHCGTCGTCVERREAFMLARIPDPTIYAPFGPA